MRDLAVFPMAMASLAGATLGLLFFVGLWWTVRRAALSARPALWLGPGFILRMTVAMGGFYLVGDGTWPRLAACLAGFVFARMAVLRFAPNLPSDPPRVPHAS